jgi:hypothetical protein
MLSPEQTSFLNDLRQRSLPGSTNPPTLDEMKQAILYLREGRKSVPQDSSKPKSKAKPTSEAIGSLLSDFMNE